MDNRIFGLDPQLLFDTAIGLLAMLVLFILLSYLLFNPARKLIQKRKEFIASQLEEAAKAEAERLAAEEAAKTGKETGMERTDEGIRSYAERKCTSGKATVGTYADTCSRVFAACCTACIG